MLQDLNRTGTYRKGFLDNSVDFKDKIVMDVGCGSGILSIFAAQAGAKKVYAVEASNMAESAQKLVNHNKLSHIIQVVPKRLEDIEEEEIAANSIDCIVSEPLGTYLYNERMLETYVIARDKFLKKEGGRMWPTECDFHIVPFEDEQLYYDLLQKCEFWYQKFHGFDLSCVAEDAADEKFTQPILECYNPEFK